MLQHAGPTGACRRALAGVALAIVALLWTAPTWAGVRGDPLAGRKLYMTYCYTCHGVTGRGDGPAAARLAIKPANLTDDTSMSKKTDQHLYTVISGGSTAIHRFSEMPAWGSVLYHEQIWDIIAYVHILHHPPAGPRQPMVQPGRADRGKRLYTDYCAVCHGPDGQGDGPVARMFGPKPADFTDRAAMAAKQDQDLYFAIFDGGEAIGQSGFMPRWGGLLQDQEIWDVIAHLRSLARE